jgi:hypothetical protein
VLVVACQQVLSIDGEVAVAPHPVSACGMTLTSGVCQACVASKCCSQLEACANNPACKPYEACLLGCGDDYACRAKCLADHPINSGVEIPSLDTCVATECKDACGISCGLAGSYVKGDAAVACQECLVTQACIPAEKCGTDLSCQIASRCATSCVTLDCRTACLFAATDAGQAEALDLAVRVATRCPSSCGLGRDWSCVGSILWPPAKASTQTLTVTVRDADQKLFLGGATVKACTNTDFDCATPLAHGTAAADGTVTLQIRGDVVGFGFQGYLDVSQPGYVPVLTFFSYPLSEANVPVDMPLLSTSSFQTTLAAGNVAYDPSLGIVQGSAGDCFMFFAPDVVMSVDPTTPKTAVYYLDGRTLSSARAATDTTGVAFIVNTPVNVHLAVRVTPLATNKVASVASVFTRPGTISTVPLIPTPL